MNWRKQLALSAVRAKFKILSALSKKKAARSAFELFCTPPGRHKPVLPPLYQSAQSIRFNFGRETIRGFSWNSNGTGKLLIVHGFMSSSVNFEAHVQAQMKAGWQVFAFDAPAHGGSSGKRMNALLYRDFLLEVVNRFGPFQAVLAHSLGGLAISLALEKWPAGHLPRLVLIAPATETRTAIEQYFEMIAIHDKKVHREFENIIVELSGQKADWFSIKRIMPLVSTPVLWIHDEDDDVTPMRDAEKVWDLKLPHLKLMRTKALGHRKIYRDSRVIEAATQFLTEGIEKNKTRAN